MYFAPFFFDDTAAHARTPGFSPVTAVAASASFDNDALDSYSSMTSVVGRITVLSFGASAQYSFMSAPVASYPGARDSSTGAPPWFPGPVVVCFVAD